MNFGMDKYVGRQENCYVPTWSRYHVWMNTTDCVGWEAKDGLRAMRVSERARERRRTRCEEV